MIYVTGDTHGSCHQDGKKLFEADYIKSEDYLIICGDFGFIFDPKGSKREQDNRAKLRSLPYTLLFIDGNHENFDRLLSDEFEKVEMFGSVVSQIEPNIFHLRRGNVYTIEGKKFLTIGGGLSIDQYRRTLGISYWEQELLSRAEQDKVLDLIEMNNTFDYVITHAAPETIVETLINKQLLIGSDKLHDPVSTFLSHVADNIEFKKWYCGHYHLDGKMSYKNGELHILYDKILAVE